MRNAKLSILLLAFVAIVWPQPSHAQDWPAKPVKIVVAFAPGGAADLFARLLAAEMSTTFKQQFYVENIAGSAGAIGTGQAARAPAGRLYAVDRRRWSATDQPGSQSPMSAMTRCGTSPTSP